MTFSQSFLRGGLLGTAFLLTISTVRADVGAPEAAAPLAGLDFTLARDGAVDPGACAAELAYAPQRRAYACHITISDTDLRDPVLSIVPRYDEDRYRATVRARTRNGVVALDAPSGLSLPLPAWVGRAELLRSEAVLVLRDRDGQVSEYEIEYSYQPYR
jgi:hypothetical protein